MIHRNDQFLGAGGYALMGAVFEVHKELGGGLSEELYHESYEIELTSRQIPYSSKAEVEVFYKDQLLRKKYIPDLLVYGEIITELKAVKTLDASHEQQVLNYMHISRKPIGYLINFGPIESLQWKRFIIKTYIPVGRDSA